MPKGKEKAKPTKKPDTKPKSGHPDTIKEKDDNTMPRGNAQIDNQWGMSDSTNSNSILGIQNVSDYMRDPLIFENEESK